MFTRLMIFESLQRLFAKGNENLFSISMRAPCAGIRDGTRCADRQQRASSLDDVRLRSEADLEQPEVGRGLTSRRVGCAVHSETRQQKAGLVPTLHATERFQRPVADTRSVDSFNTSKNGTSRHWKL
jgi:hypothetical protein